MVKTGLSISQLNKLLKKWQRILLLGGWKLRIETVDFKRKDFRQSGDIKVNPRKKQAVVLLSNNPFLDEEEVLVHELIHLILWDFDRFCEKPILRNSKRPQSGMHAAYLGKLEVLADYLTKIVYRERKINKRRCDEDHRSSRRA